MTMQKTNHWTRTDNKLIGVYSFTEFTAAMSFVIAVGRESEKSKHHPTIHIRHRIVELELTTVDQGNTLTDLDYTLADKIEHLYAPFLKQILLVSED